MESEVQEATKVPRSELDTAFDQFSSGRWMVVQGMSTTPWGYVLFHVDRQDLDPVEVILDLP
jgi:hypothetical protein